MTNSLDHIERYFTGQLTAAERLEFEKKCESDPEFAREVSLYISMRGALKKSLRDFKKKDLESFSKAHSSQKTVKPKVIPLFGYVAAIAASVLIFIMVYFYLDKPDAREMATAYIQDNLQTISVTMGTVQDSLALGINAYNDQDFSRAEKIFSDLAVYPSIEFECIKYLGLVYLTTGSYDQALVQFDRLAKYEDAYGNPGLFYKALTLMKRSEGSDVPEAKQILEVVVKEKKAGYKEGARWLETLE